MEPFDHKDYPQVYMPHYQYQNENQGIFPGEFPQMPPQQIPGMQMMSNPQQMPQYFPQPQPQIGFPPNIPTSISQDINSRGKRRSKNEPEGRNFKCKQCERTYLSYPALYTHIKTKHNTAGSSSIHTGRGRGRPKKSVRHFT